METKWYYSHNRRTLGPFTAEQMRECVAQHKIQPDDLVWLQGSSPKHAVAAEAVLLFDSFATSAAPATPEASVGPPSPSAPPLPSRLVSSSLPPAVSGQVPDWLSDVQAVESEGAAPAASAPAEAPDWLEDLRLWIGLDLYTPLDVLLLETPPDNEVEVEAPPEAKGLPDWLEGWTSEDMPRRVAPRHEGAPGPVVPLAEPMPAPVEEVVPLAQPIAPASAEVIPLAEPILPVAEPVAPTVVPAALARQEPATVVPLAEPLPPPTKAPMPDRRTSVPRTRTTVEKDLVDKTVRETGFDPSTGRIVDPAKFQEWKTANRSTCTEAGATNASIFEVFRKARTEIERWVDDDQNQGRLIHAEWKQLQSHPALQQILDKYSGYGKEMHDKLVRHLQFMVENRRRYSRAKQKSR
jgi:hypothetical protein